METTFRHKSDLKKLISQGARIFQRYIVPENYMLQVKIVHWSRTKSTRVYTLGSRLPVKAKKTGITAESFSSCSESVEPAIPMDPFIVSVHNVRAPDVAQESGLFEEAERILEVLKTDVLGQVLDSQEVLEELVFSVLKSQDGKLYLLSLLRARVSSDQSSQSQGSMCPHRVSIQEVLHDQSALERLNCKPMPFLSLTDLHDYTRELYLKQLPTPKTVQPTPPADSIITGHLDTVVSLFDKLKHESQWLKHEFGVVRKVDYSCYPVGFLENVIGRLYTNIMHDSRLNRYYHDRSTIRSRLEAAVTETVKKGTSRYLKLKMRKIHENMGITEGDFDQYVKYFSEAMRAEDAREADIEDAIGFLNDFKNEVVIEKKEETDLETAH